MPYQSTKTYGHDLGLSACFRQHRAVHSHCSLLHGYALSFKFVFECDELDDKNWVQDFGGLKQLKQWLMSRFDHKLVVAQDDPNKDDLCMLEGLGLAEVMVLPKVGCEAFAEMAYDFASALVYDGQRALFRPQTMQLLNTPSNQRVRVVSCECAEHGANSAIYIGEK
jgi:6-pyruvoyltetrahydropterin/6-carboxytetrahydropterin synthase